MYPEGEPRFTMRGPHYDRRNGWEGLIKALQCSNPVREKQNYLVSEPFDSSPVVGVSVSSECDSTTKGAERNLVGSTP
jgi:hypothetical protein